MIEKIILDYLTTALSPVPVYMETPEAVPIKYVLLEKTAGGEADTIETATLAIQSIDTTLFKAAQLNTAVKSAMRLAPAACPEVFRAKLNSDYNFTDTKTKQYRYQAVYNLSYKED